MQLNVLFDFLGKSFLPQGEVAAKNADQLDQPAGFGAALAAAFGLVSRDGSYDLSADFVAEGEAVQGDPRASISDGEEATTSSPRETGAPQTSGVNALAPVESSPAMEAAKTHPDEPPAHVPEAEASTTEEPLGTTGMTAEPAPNSADVLTPNDVLPTASASSEGVPATAARIENPPAESSREMPSTSIPAPADAASTAGDPGNERPQSPSTPLTPAGVSSGEAKETWNNPPSSPDASSEQPGAAAAARSTPASFVQTTTMEAERNRADRHDSRPGAAAASDLPPSEVSPPVASSSEDASGTHQAPSTADRSGHESVGDTGPTSPKAETGRPDQTIAAGRAGESVLHTDTVGTNDSADVREPGVRAADLARAAKHPSEAAALPEASKSSPNVQPFTSGGKSGDRAVSPSNPPLPQADLPPGVEHVTLLEDGTSSESGPDASARRARATATSSTPAPSTTAPGASTHAAPPALDADAVAEARPESPDETVQEAVGDAEGGDEREIGVTRSDEGVRRTDSDRRDVHRKEASDKPHPASQGDRPFSQGDADTYSNSRDRQLSFRRERAGAADVVSTEFVPPVDDLPTHDVHVDVDPASDESAFTPEQKTTVAGVTATEGVQSSARTRTPGSMAWLRSMLAQSTKTLDLAQGWKSIEVQLEEGLGTMTVKARRSEDGVSVSVTFSDPHLRTLAEANAHRLQDVLRSEYEANVDLSLMSDGSTDTPGDRNRPGTGRTAGQGGVMSEASAPDALDRSAASRPAAPGKRNEWIG